MREPAARKRIKLHAAVDREAPDRALEEAVDSLRVAESRLEYELTSVRSQLNAALQILAARKGLPITVPLVHIARLGPEALVTSFRADMAGHLKKAKKEAMKACDGKTHILNESEPVVEAVKDMHSKLKTFDNMSECTHARLICILAEALADFELEGKNEDFSGDEVLCELDKEMLGLLGSIRSKGNVDDVDNTWRPVLGQIAKLFTCSTYKRFQAYGLFEFDGMCLQSGEVAATMLAR